ncbi:MAG: hypothetical protein IPK00_16720 [Deltaproteobacteria bacterium]|nr:hypothetical protein [Deltaproteobacteria bacterium]
MSIPPSPPHDPASRIAAVARGVAPAIALALAVGACAKPDALSFTPEDLDRDRAAREVTLAEIERDHETLAALIASDRFEAPEAIYSDPELREIALHLVEQARKLRHLADSDVLSPGTP